MKRAQDKEMNKHINKKMLRDKFGFSDEEETDDNQNKNNAASKVNEEYNNKKSLASL